jgi:hypothetical protein
MNRVVVWSIVAACFVGIGVLAYPFFAPARATDDHPPSCVSHLKLCMMAQLIYAGDFDDHLPPCTTWMGATFPYSKNDGIYHCPDLKDAKKDEYGYAMNVAMSRVRTVDINKPELEPVLFDSLLLARNACSGFYGFPDPKQRKTVVAYSDGHVKVIPEGKR